MRVSFRIGDVFPPGDTVSQFLIGLCMAVNDVALLVRRLEQIHDTPEGQSGESAYYLYLTCAYYREAAKFLQHRLEDAEVASFLPSLPTYVRHGARKELE